MPPAFNLSQDQTLQFNSCFFASALSLTPRLRSLSNGIESFLPCFHLLQCETLISSLPLYFRSSHTDRFVAKFLKNFFRLPLGATRFGILHKSEPFCKFRYFLSVPCSLASFVRFLFRSLAARGRIISAFSALSIADFANHNPWGFLFLTH